MNPYKFADLPPINDCPFCHGVDVQLNQDVFETNQPWVSCPGCQATGPDAEDAAQAIKLWNGPTDDIDNLSKDCDRLRRELDDEMGIMR